MTPPLPENGPLATDTDALTERERALLAVLEMSQGRVLPRLELARRAGLRGIQPHRVDVLLVNIRKVVGSERIVNVRGRGWMLLAADESPPRSGAADHR